MAPRVATYSIAACDLDARQWGVAVQSKFLAAASVVSWAEPEAGAVATQAYANPRYGPDGLALLREGLSAEEAVRRLTEADDGRDHRQLGIVDREGRQRHVHRLGVLRLGGRPHGPVLRGPGQHPRLGGDGRRAGRDVRGQRGQAARRAAARLPRRGAGGRRRPARPAGGGRARGRARRRLRRALRRRRRPARRRPRAPDRGAAAHPRHPRTCCSARRRRRSGWTWTRRSRGELSERLARLGYEGELADALFRWGGSENLEERIDGAERDRPGRA